MLLKKAVISGYKSISTDHPQTIEFDEQLTVFIGHNGTGKSTALEALNKLFSTDHSLRGIIPSDFHLPDEMNPETPRNLMIEAWFSFADTEGNLSLPILINGLTATSSTEEIIFRVRLEASLSFDYNPLGDVDENIWIIDGDMNFPEEGNKHRLSAAQRNAIQINYIPANRDPLVQLKYSSKAVLGRLLKSIKWSDTEKLSFEQQAEALNLLALNNLALTEITQAINRNWQTIYKGRHLNQADLSFPVGNIDEILKLIQLQFMPDATRKKVDISRLSDGQKSLVYFSLMKALFDIDKATRELSDITVSNFDVERMKLPIFSLILLEEPENHLSPHYLGRILKLVKDYGATKYCQAVISTHSASLVGRIKPSQIRHFRLDNKNKCTSIQKLLLPKNDDEQFKYINEAIKAYPEIYFSKLVILGEGDSEQVIIPKLIEHLKKDIDGYSISVVPLGGRHVNHFWRLLNSLKIPFVTLLDFDIDRNGGGFGRLKYAIEQLCILGDTNNIYINNSIKEHIPDWDNDKNPVTFSLKYTDNQTKRIVDELEKCNVFFSSPLDIDYSMINSFPEIFCEKDIYYGERGPLEGKEDEEEKDIVEREKALIKAVLKKGHIGKRFNFGNDWERNFLWYRYRFLSNKSKPASHVRMFTKIENKYTSEQILEKLPVELKRMMGRVVYLLEQVIE
ncbi:ATP-dependent nuclease [Proteus vulgaris]|uniref:ATP-dependent nuclease n=1 Tax=Proteus vulgaris TaxID=585 RepID=UPI000658A63B|nr:AAA family ATPase [Proteus vulgaris]CRL66031.1 hypothetical protein BN1805_03840 [Proteus vulgaris]